jgi:hypothetical protein
MGRTRLATWLAVVGAGVVIVALLAACGSGSRSASGPFAWLRPASPPAGWHVARIPGGAALAYPPGWSAIKTDPGTASIALRGTGGRIDGYLNVTPKQGAETLANWSVFRPRKNRAEGERDVHLLAAAENVRLGSARGSCVIDSYTTSVTAYEEIACLVSGRSASAVVVAASPVRLWRERAAVLEHAISSFEV